MFAALMLVRFREAVYEVSGLMETAAWVSDDNVEAPELPLAKATEKVLASMHEVLTKTKEKRDEAIQKHNARIEGRGQEEDKKRLHLVESKAAEIRLVRNLENLKSPVVKFRAETI
jgi:pyridoxine kinase